MKPEEMFLAYARENHLSGDDLEFSQWHFCDNQKDADELAGIVLGGKKTATASLLCLYEKDGDILPKIGDYSVIENWKGNAVCIIKTIAVNIVPYNEVSGDFAQKEGEGDLSLDYWKTAHKDYFTRTLLEYDMDFKEDMLIVCEEFEVMTFKGK